MLCKKIGHDEEIERRRKEELQNFKKLLNKSIRGKQVQVLREFIDDAETRSITGGEDSKEFRNWISWARKKILIGMIPI